VQHLLLIGDLRHGLGDARIHVADEKGNLIALDQLARLLHTGADVVRGVLHQQLDGPSEDAPPGVDLFDGKSGAHDFVLGNGRIDAGQGIDHADAQRRFGAPG
jgi:hypothetical protein